MKLEELQELNLIKEVIDLNPELNDPVTATTFHELVHFNEDMKELALNAY